MKSTWRTHAAIIIEQTIRQQGTDDMTALRRALREAYPFGERKYHPYKIWCDEIKRQLGQKRSKIRLTADEQERRGQQTLF